MVAKRKGFQPFFNPDDVKKQYGDDQAQANWLSADVDPHWRRRVHDASVTVPDAINDWESHAFDSSRVLSARYSASRQRLEVEWTNAPGGMPYPMYTYDSVPPAVWTGFRSSGSAGRFVNHTLNSFPYRPS